MIEVKIVSRGNSLALSLPKDGRFKKGQRWLLIPSSDNEAFMLVPRIDNPYADSNSSPLMTEEWGNVDWNKVE